MNASGIRRRNIRSNGYTLVELLVVCSIIGVLLVIAWPSYATSLKSARLKNTSYRIAADIRTAQQLAQTGWTRSRFLFADDWYEIQVGTEPYPSVSCSAGPLPGYTTVKRVEMNDLDAEFANATVDCLVFERSGRVAATAPTVVDTTPPFDASVLPRVLNGARFQGTTPWDISSETVRWQSYTTVRLVVDLGEERELSWIRPCMAEKLSNQLPLPTQVQLSWSPTLIGRDDAGWTTIGDPIVPDAACEQFLVSSVTGGPVRYLRLEFLPGRIGPRHRLAVDEIEFEQPGFEVQDPSGRLTRSLTVNPVSGVVIVK